MTVLAIAAAGVLAGLLLGLTVRRTRVTRLTENHDWLAEDLEARKFADLRDLHEPLEPPEWMRLGPDRWGARWRT